MTRIRVPYRIVGVLAMALTGLVSPNVYSQQGGRATLIGAAAGQQTCTYSSIAMQPTGQIDVTCTATIPGALGSIGFNTSSYAPVTKDATTASVPISITVVRTGGNTGVLDATLTASAPCSPGSQPVHFLDGGVTSAAYTLTANATGSCTLGLTAVTAGSTLGIAASTVAINAPAAGGNVTPAPAGCPATPSNVVMHTLGIQSINQIIRDDPRGMIHVFPLPATRSTGAPVNSGTFSFTTDSSNTPTSLTVEVSISKCPGDTDTWKTATLPMFGVNWTPCGAPGTGSQAGLGWILGAGSYYQCGVPATEQWYMNWKVTGGCPAGAVCTQVFNWNGQ